MRRGVEGSSSAVPRSSNNAEILNSPWDGANAELLRLFLHFYLKRRAG